MYAFRNMLGIACVIMCASLAHAAPARHEAHMYADRTLQVDFLRRFGYLSSSMAVAVSDIMEQGSVPSTFTAAVKAFQQMSNLPQTGLVDAETRTMMAAPRCGNHDNVRRRRRRYSRRGEKWEFTTLTWRILHYTRTMDHQGQVEEISDALSVWAAVTPLTFVHKPYEDAGSVNLQFSFYLGNHGDQSPFDGVDGVLAHAFYYTGQGSSMIHFDEAEIWTINTRDGHNLRWVAIHEVGHTLGLDHSRVPNALMGPTYHQWTSNDNLLQRDDIQGIQSIYGLPGSTGVKPSAAPSRWHCDTSNITAIFTLGADTYMFLGTSSVMKAESNRLRGTLQGSPFSNINSLIDAVLYINGRIYVFVDYLLYVYNERLVFILQTYITVVFSGINGQVDAAFANAGNVYILKGGYSYAMQWSGSVWKVRDKQTAATRWTIPPVCQGAVTAATTWVNNKLYFFCQRNYYQFDLDTEQVATVGSGLQAYPRLSANWWLGCPPSSNVIASSSSPGGAFIGENLTGVELGAARGTSVTPLPALATAYYIYWLLCYVLFL